MSAEPDRFSLSALREARALLGGVATTTPVEESRWLSGVVGGPVLLKCENLQRTGSFKIRGALVRMARLTAEQRARGVAAASAGNHAQGVALAGQLLGIEVTVFMPEGASIPKERATRGYGAEVVFAGQHIEGALAAAAEFCERTGATLIHPFDHPDVVAGQASVGLEVLEQVPDVRTIVVPTGGGGLLAGVAVAVRAAAPDVRVVGVQAAGAAAWPGSMAHGAPLALEQMATMADGIAVGLPGQVTFDAVRGRVDTMLTVSEEALSSGVLAVLERAKMVVEPAGAAGVAALLDRPAEVEAPVVVVLSGGNVDPLLLGKVIRFGMIADGRYLQLRAHVTDRPGGLAALLTEVAASGANLLEVVHERTTAGLHLDEVVVQLQLETRGASHAERVVAHLAECGYRIDPS